jgi:hypothetical protein
MLKNSETGNQEPKKHDKPAEAAPILDGLKKLRSKKEHQKIGDKQLQFNAGLERGRRQTKKPLSGNDRYKTQKWQKQGRQKDGFLAPNESSYTPGQKKKACAGFKNSASPFFNSSEREDVEGYQSEQGVTEHSHGLVT